MTYRRTTQVVSAALGLLCLSALPASAQTTCKGLSKGACNGNNSCSYVKAFIRADGAQVSAFCRAKPVRKKGSKVSGSDATEVGSLNKSSGASKKKKPASD